MLRSNFNVTTWKQIQCFCISTRSFERIYGINDAVVIDAEYTGVIVLAAYVAHQINGDIGIKEKGDIFDCKS